MVIVEVDKNRLLSEIITASPYLDVFRRGIRVLLDKTGSSIGLPLESITMETLRYPSADEFEMAVNGALISAGRLAKRKEGGESPEQRRRLREEGVTLDALGRIALKDHAWPGPSWHWLEAQGINVEELVLKSGALKRRGIWANWRF